jgi:FdhD protein
MLLHGVTGGDKTLFTTGRLSAEMVIKAGYSGIPILVSRNGVTGMGHELARRLGMTLFGRAAKERFVCYVGAERFDR